MGMMDLQHPIEYQFLRSELNGRLKYFSWLKVSSIDAKHVSILTDYSEKRNNGRKYYGRIKTELRNKKS